MHPIREGLGLKAQGKSNWIKLIICFSLTPYALRLEPLRLAKPLNADLAQRSRFSILKQTKPGLSVLKAVKAWPGKRKARPYKPLLNRDSALLNDLPVAIHYLDHDKGLFFVEAIVILG